LWSSGLCLLIVLYVDNDMNVEEIGFAGLD
jgi:hypothetical protein